MVVKNHSSPYKSISSTGVIDTPTSQVPIPTTAYVGDFGTFGTSSGSDGTITTTTWKLYPEFNGASILAISSIIKTGNDTTATEFDSYYLDAAGVPTKLKISITTSDVIVNLSGSKN